MAILIDLIRATLAKTSFTPDGAGHAHQPTECKAVKGIFDRVDASHNV